MVHRMNLINSNAVARVGRYFSTSCSTSASEQIKEITIENLTLVNGDIIGVTFSNENSYGDCTLITPTYPTLKLNSGSALPICDSHGHTVGKGCWNSGDYIELRYCGDKFIIINSDVRQCVNGESGYTIYSNGLCRQYYNQYLSNGSGKINLLVAYSNTNYSVKGMANRYSESEGNCSYEFFNKTTSSIYVGYRWQGFYKANTISITLEGYI